MTQKISPFLEGKFGWNYGESGWNSGMDENLLKFSFLFDRNIDGVVGSLPTAPSDGQAYFLTADARFYFRVGGTWYSSPVPKWSKFQIKGTGELYQFDGTAAQVIDSPVQIDSRLDSVEITLSSLGSAAFSSVSDFATAEQLSLVEAYGQSYTDDFKNSLAGPTGTDLVGKGDTNLTVALSRIGKGKVNVLDYGAVGDGVVDDTTSIRSAIAALKSMEGGTLYFPKGRYKVSTSDANLACLWIDFNGVRITGDGELSEIFTTANDHVPIHVCAQESMATPAGAVDVIDGFICENIHVKGTGIYQYYSLANGRGILIRRAKNCFVRNNWVTGMSMIGICTENGQGNFSIVGNRVKDCRYSAINFNGRAYNSIIEGNICSGSNAGVNSCVIQVDGPCIVRGNTIYGDVTDFANCGGIMWGEGPYDGIGLIEGNLILHCRYGIKSIYHGSVSIVNNVLINCRATQGIICGGGTSGAFTVENSHNLVANNLLINCAPYPIETSAPNTVITGNIIRNIINPTLPSATSEPDAIFNVTVQAGIRVRAAGCSITNNFIDGAVRGISTTLGQADGSISANTVTNCSSTFYAVEGDSGVFVATPSRTRENLGGTTYVDQVVSGSIPGTSYYPSGSRWRPSAYVIGQPTGAIVLQSRIDSVATTAAAGATTVDIVGSANFVAGTNSKVGIKLDNGSYHWTTIASNTGNTLTLAAAIPAGRTAPAGNPVYVTVWRPEANLV